MDPADGDIGDPEQGEPKEEEGVQVPEEEEREKDKVNGEKGAEDEDSSADSGEGSSSDDDGGDEGKQWLDVRDLRNLSLQEVKKLLADDNSNANESVPSRKVDQPITKVIVRRLPPEITIEGYLEELPEIPSYNYIRLVPQHKDFPSRIGKRSSIYINFDKEEEAFWFKEKYNNMTLFDEYGNDYISCVDFSLIQDLAKDPEDEPQMGTLEESEVYKEFLGIFEDDPWAFCMVRPNNIPTPEAMLEEILSKNFAENDNTPLLQFLRRRTEKDENDRKDRELRRRERDASRRKQKEESARRKQKDKDEARKKLKEKDEAVKREKKERRRERDRERQRERDRERRLRRDKERAAAAAEKQTPGQDSKGSGTGEQPVPDKIPPSQTAKETPKRTDAEKDSKNKSSGNGNVTYSKSGNVTRWSENSGPRKGDKRNKDDPKKSGDPKPSSSSEVSTESKSQKSENKNEVPGQRETKSPFGKPFPVKDKETTSGKATEDKGKKDTTNKNTGTVEKPKPKPQESSSTVAGSEGGKKKIVKKVIRVKKVSREKEDGTGKDDQDNSETKPKRIVRVVRKTSKSEEGGGPSKPSTSAATVKSEDARQGGKATNNNTSTSTQDAKPESEKERKNRKGRPEIQIYRPGSLRGGGSSNKPSTSKSASVTGGDKEKGTERSSDNNS